MRASFYELFCDNGNGSYTPRHDVKICGETISPTVTLRTGVAFSGVDIALFAGKDLNVVKNKDGIIEIKGIY